MKIKTAECFVQQDVAHHPAKHQRSISDAAVVSLSCEAVVSLCYVGTLTPFYFPIFVAALYLLGPFSVLVQRSTTRLWVYVEGRFPSCVCPFQWCVAGRWRRSKFGRVVFSGRFFPCGAHSCCVMFGMMFWHHSSTAIINSV